MESNNDEMFDIITDTLSINFFQANKNESFSDTLVNHCNFPHSVIAQSYQGCYGIELCQGLPLKTQTGGAFVILKNTPYKVTHFAEQNTFMKARWVFFDFSVFHSVDVLSLVDVPTIINPDISMELGQIIIDMLKCQETVYAFPLQIAAKPTNLHLNF